MIQLNLTLPDGEKPKKWPELTQELLKTLIRADAETGDIFSLKKRRGPQPNGGKLGAICCGPGGQRRLMTRINGVRHYNSRLIWLYFHGYLPPEGRVIDHINRNPLDNRLANLRDVSNKENSRNRTPCKRNTSGHAGVSFNKRPSSKPWVAFVQLDSGKQLNRWYKTYEEACVAADAMRAEAYGEHAPR